MSVETIRKLMGDIRDLRIANAELEVKCAKLMDLAKRAQNNQDYWKKLYYDLIHNKTSRSNGDMPDMFKDIFK